MRRAAIDEQNRLMLRRQHQFRQAADVVTGSDRYLGRLCSFSTCPKDKPDRRVSGCGAIAFNKRVAQFRPHADLLASAPFAKLYERGAGRLRSALDLPSIDHDNGMSA